MKVEKRLIGFFSLFLFLVLSCSTPPPHTQQSDFLKLFYSVMTGDEKPVSIIDTLQQFRNYAGVEDLITVMYKNDRLKLHDKKAQPDENTIIYTLGDRTLKMHRDMYLTSGRNGDPFLSLDGVNWFSTLNNRKKGQLNMEYQYPLETNFNPVDHTLDISFSWTAGLSEYAKPVKMRRKKIIELLPGDIFYSTKKNNNTINLVDSFLKIPKGTEFLLNFHFSGNLLNSLIIEEGFLIEILRDFYIYSSDASNLRMGISLNGTDWNFGLFSFKYDVEADFYILSNGSILYNRDMKFLYSRD